MSNDTTPAAGRGSDSSEGLGGGSDRLRNAVFTVLEGWNLPADARKVLEAALWSAPQPAERVPLTDGQIDLLTEHIYLAGRPVSKTYRVALARALGIKPLNAKLTGEA